eukprot:jgi/Mesvir1/9372/Mv08987-RA.1
MNLISCGSVQVVCSQGKRGDGPDGGISYKDTLNSFLDKFLPKRRQPRLASSAAIAEDLANKRIGMPIKALRDLLADVIQRDQWFITGNVDRTLFASDFFFGDPSVNVVGVDNYADGVRRLFDQSVSRLDIISAEVINPTQILIVWRLEGRVNLPFKPTLKPYVVRTTYTVDKQGLLCRQEETFDIPSWDVVLSAFVPALGYAIGAPAAPPVVRPK